MDAPAQNSRTSTFGFLSVVYVLVGLTAIYFLYRFLYTPMNSTGVVITGGQKAANSIIDKFPAVPTPYEGGEYSVNTWIYVSSYNTNLNTRKHLFELRGTYFSTLLIGLGAFKNTLFVRTHTNSTEGFQNKPSSVMSNALAKLLPAQLQSALRVEGFQASGSGSGSRGSGSGPAMFNRQSNADEIRRQLDAGVYNSDESAGSKSPGTTDTPYPKIIGNLSADSVAAMFEPLAMDDVLLDAPPICDLTEVDLQRWTMVSVVLSGRTIDVYIDGKLSRSCVAKSYYKVDPTGVKPIMTDHGGFDGYTGTTTVANYAMNPDEIYRAYLSGPHSGNNTDFFTWFVSLFKDSS
jgi:hypothetical protein